MHLPLFVSLFSFSVLSVWLSPNGTDTPNCGTLVYPCLSFIYGLSVAKLQSPNCTQQPVILELLPAVHTDFMDFTLEGSCDFRIRAPAGATVVRTKTITLFGGFLLVSNVTFRMDSSEALFLTANSILQLEGCRIMAENGAVILGAYTDVNIMSCYIAAPQILQIINSSATIDNSSLVSFSPKADATIFLAVTSNITILRSNISQCSITVGAIYPSRFSIFATSIRSTCNTSFATFFAPSVPWDACPAWDLQNIDFEFLQPETLIAWSGKPPCSLLDLCANCTISFPSTSFEVGQWRTYDEAAWESSSPASVTFLSPGPPSRVVVGLKFEFSVAITDFFGKPARVLSTALTVDGPPDALLRGPTDQFSSAQGLVTFSGLTLTGSLGNMTLRLKVGARGVIAYRLNVMEAAANVKLDVSIPTTLLPCPSGYGFVSALTECELCPAGTYNRLGDLKCLPCPDGATCLGGDALSTRKGWWWSGSNCVPIFEQCFEEESCCADSCPVPPCNGAQVSWDDKDCGENRHGVLCTQCDEGFSEWGKQCADCRDGNDKTLAFAYLQPIFILQLGMFLNALRTTDGRTTVGQVIFFYQVAALLLAESNHNFGFLSWALFDISVFDTNIVCVLDTTPLGKLSLAFVGPLLPLGYSFVTFLLLLLPCRLEKIPGLFQKAAIRMPNFATLPAITAKVMILTSFLPLSRAVFSLFVCTNRASIEVLKSAPGVQCWTGLHSTAGGIGIFLFVLLLLIPLGVHFLINNLLVKRRNELLSPDYMYMYGDLYAPFRDGVFRSWYRPFLMIQGLIIATIPLLVNERQMRLLTAMVLLVFFLVLHVVLLPHRHPADLLRAKCHLLLLIVIAVLESAQDDDLFGLLVLLLLLPLLSAVIETLRAKKNKSTAHGADRDSPDGSTPNEGIERQLETSSPSSDTPDGPSASPNSSQPDLDSNLEHQSTDAHQPPNTSIPRHQNRKQTDSEYNPKSKSCSRATIPRISWPIMAAMLTQTAAQVYLDPLGIDSGICDQATPCRSFPYAFSRLPASGDAQMILNPGIHLFNDTFSVNANAYSSFTISSANISSRATVAFSSTARYWTMSSCSQCVVQHLNFRDATRGLMVVFSSPHVKFASCDFVNNSDLAGCGGAIYIADDALVELSACNFVNNTANTGAAVCLSGLAFISNCVFSGCVADRGGAICGSTTPGNFIPYAEIYGSSFDRCSAFIYGGAIGGIVNVSATNTSFYFNSAGVDGAVFSIWNGASFKCVNCTLSGNVAPRASVGYLVDSTSSFVDSYITANIGDFDGALVVQHSQLSLVNCTVTGNSGGQGGVVSFLDISVLSTFVSCRFLNNSATLGGVILVLSTGGAISVFRSEFFDNVVSDNGGVVVSQHSNAQIVFEESRFARNKADLGGVGSFSQSTANFNSCYFEGNSAVAGGVFHSTGGGTNINVQDSNFLGNIAVDAGGVVAVRDRNTSIVFRDAQFTSNSARVGGVASFLNTAADFTFCDFEANRAEFGGGVIYSTGANVSLQDSNFSSNVVLRLGGVIFADSTSVITLRTNLFEKNQAKSVPGDSGWGGVIYLFGGARGFAINCSFIENSAVSGAAVALSTFGALDCKDCIFSGNNATFTGGAIWNENGVAVVASSFFQNNLAIRGGGLFLGDALDCNFEPCPRPLFAPLARSDITNCEFRGNHASSRGGALMTLGGVLSIRQNVFINNSAPNGGALFLGSPLICNRIGVCDLNSSYASSLPTAVTLENNLFTKNTATDGGALSLAFAYGKAGQDLCYGINASRNNFTDNQAIRSTAVYWAENKFALGKFFADCCPSCIASGLSLTLNNQSFSNLEGSPLAKMVILDCPSSTEPNFAFDCTLQFQDAFGTPFHEAIILADLTTDELNASQCAVISQGGFKRPSENGVVSFRLQLLGDIGDECQLRFDSHYTELDGSWSFNFIVVHNITLVPCPVNHVFVNGGCRQCELNTFSLRGEACRKSLSHMTCGVGEVLVDQGYWPTLDSNGDLLLVRCPTEACCPDAKSCPFDLNLLPDPQWPYCAPNQEGALCGQCTPGHEKWGGMCVDCTTPAVGFGFLLTFISLLVVTFILFAPSSVTSSLPRVLYPPKSDISVDSSSPSASSEGTLGGWTILHPRFIAHVLFFQSLAPILRVHRGWSFLHGVEVASLHLDMGVQECLATFSGAGRVVSAVLFPLLMFPWAAVLMLAYFKCPRVAAIFKHAKLPSIKAVMLTLGVLCLQPCVRTATTLIACVRVGDELLLATNSNQCYMGENLGPQVVSWIFLPLLTTFSLVGVIQHLLCKDSKISSWFPTPDLLFRLVGHCLVTVIAVADWADRGKGAVFIVLVCCCTVAALGEGQRDFLLVLCSFLVLPIAAFLELLSMIENPVRNSTLPMLASLVGLCLLETFLALVAFLKVLCCQFAQKGPHSVELASR